MNCEDYQEQFVEYLLCELSSSEERTIQQHLQSGCVACNIEFSAIRDGAELLFSIAPQAELSQAKLDAILTQALAVTSDERLLSVSNRSSSSSLSLTDGRNGRLQALQGLLALVAGFALILAIPDASRIEPVGTALDRRAIGPVDSGLGGVLPVTTAKPNFVSFENVSQLAQPANRSVTGFLLLDTRAGEIHLLGRRLEAVLPQTFALELQIVTASGTAHYPLKFNSSGSCKQLVPLPQEPILKIEIVSPTASSTEAARPASSRKVY